MDVLRTAAVVVIHPTVNLGGVGGFVSGLEVALRSMPSWIWLMMPFSKDMGEK